MKTLVRAIVAAGVLIGFLCGTATPAHVQKSYQEILTWSGCTAQLVTNDQFPAIDSFYTTGVLYGIPVMPPTIYVGTKEGEPPHEMALIVLLHEIGHCLQYQESPEALVAADMNPTPEIIKVWELDADRRAADLACALGYDGRGLLHDVMVWLRETHGYNGDPAHGTLSERILQGEKATACDARRQES